MQHKLAFPLRLSDFHIFTFSHFRRALAATCSCTMATPTLACSGHCYSNALPLILHWQSKSCSRCHCVAATCHLCVRVCWVPVAAARATACRFSFDFQQPFICKCSASDFCTQPRTTLGHAHLLHTERCLAARALGFFSWEFNIPKWNFKCFEFIHKLPAIVCLCLLLLFS